MKSFLMQKRLLKKVPIKTIYPKYSDIINNEDFSKNNYDGLRVAIFNESNYLELGVLEVIQKQWVVRQVCLV